MSSGRRRMSPACRALVAMWLGGLLAGAQWEAPDGGAAPDATPDAAPDSAPDATPDATLRCHRRVYRARVSRADAAGRRCWDVLSLPACWGRCDSHEVAEWRFPFKQARHPVCGFAARERASLELRHCEAGAGPEARRFLHVRPVACRCRACTAADTSCGWLPGPPAALPALD